MRTIKSTGLIAAIPVGGAFPSVSVGLGLGPEQRAERNLQMSTSSPIGLGNPSQEPSSDTPGLGIVRAG